jgi:hypothetical protein
MPEKDAKLATLRQQGTLTQVPQLVRICDFFEPF